MSVTVELLSPNQLSGAVRTALKEASSFLAKEGELFLLRGDQVFRCEDSEEGRRLMRSLAQPEEALSASENGPLWEGEALRQLLSPCGEERRRSLLSRLRLPERGACFVIVLRCAQPCARTSLKDTVSEVAPMEAEDRLIARDEETAVLIKHGEDPEEAGEFVLALIDTVEGETGLRLEAGISDPHAGPAEWPEGLEEALSAIRTGKSFRLRGPVWLYRRQLLERLLGEIPAARRSVYRQQIFNERTRRVLNAETLETVEMFFASDLNLSDTARQMFIHRNTLTYRLDKIRKETGLDLRKFTDSVIFRVLMALPEENEKRMDEA